MLTSIKIEKLFDIFDYDIEFKEEGITILTGPNGYGKTTVLKILDALATQNGPFFIGLLFKKIVLEFSDRNVITLQKEDDNDVLIKTLGKSKTVHLNRKSFNSALQKILKDMPFLRPLDADKWLDRRTDNIYNTETLLQKFLPIFPEFAAAIHAIGLPIIPEVYFIREQRLLLPVLSPRRRQFSSRPYMEEEVFDTFSKTIEEYAKELRENIRETLAKSSQINQELDSSFPRRLFDQQQDISEEEFKHRFDKVREIQKSLSEFELFDIKEDSHPTYKPENAKALYVYIDDTEKKLAVFSDLLGKLKAFTGILNERRFTFKRIDISKEDGFKFSTDLAKPLALGDLSSGEQQEVVLLYELLFKVKPGTLVLIDEPELSLHVVWQKQFLDDLFKIIELQKINIVVATHSPQIINNHWDLTVDLEELRDAALSK
ncbi:AAA family ATPase [Methylobacter tundripaludum]|uniref:ATPase n=1 Tax=Methylobacter tundripaludum (strain ATCC BAA-1195 / DSM 17260 / SV96) TaxID=697282 RepID=G3IVX4_METTV|nr:AAA family ATPase [Methylobacter tundripaludum]EGW22981.1 ATPase [Methylobacter tundripaludum SV96]